MARKRIFVAIECEETETLTEENLEWVLSNYYPSGSPYKIQLLDFVERDVKEIDYLERNDGTIIPLIKFSVDSSEMRIDDVMKKMMEDFSRGFAEGKRRMKEWKKKNKKGE